MKCAIYRRVSTDMQAEKGSSLEAQKERLTAFAISQGWEIAYDYVDDGYSAKNTERPAFQQMIQGMKERQFDIILVYKLDRFTRSVPDLHNLLKTMDEYNVKFKSSTEIFETTTATGRMFITLVATFAQWEREQTAERVSMIMNERSKKGLWNGGPMPYGYVLEDNVVRIIEDEAKVVKMCFEKAITHGAQAIAKFLNENNYRTKSGTLWLMRSILRMLHNPLYKGYVTYEEDNSIQLSKVNIEGFEPLVSEELFDKVQYIIKKRTISPTRMKGDNFFPFSGILVCPTCGGKMSGTSITTKGVTYRYYRCSRVVHGVCNHPLISEKNIDSVFSKVLISIVDNLKVTQNTDAGIDKNSVEKQMKILERKRMRIKELYIEGDFSRIEYDEKIRILNDKKEELLSSLENANQQMSQQDLTDIVERMRDSWGLWPAEAKTKVMRGLFSEIHFEHISKRKLEIIDYKFI
ncbi:TPA: recombinase family protein [Bacillus paranthracis]